MKANASLDVEITFSSDHEERFSTDYIVEIPASDDATEHIISVKGWCWSRQGYAVAVGRDTAGENNEPVVPEDVFTIPPALLGGAEPSALLLPTLQPVRRIVLEFHPTDGVTQVRVCERSEEGEMRGE